MAWDDVNRIGDSAVLLCCHDTIYQPRRDLKICSYHSRLLDFVDSTASTNPGAT
ncbi:MAG: hypothetical protein AB7H80_02380 [Candidatus Kapaibacterium sp.]